jgi:hypothetical protein
MSFVGEAKRACFLFVVPVAFFYFFVCATSVRQLSCHGCSRPSREDSATDEQLGIRCNKRDI